MPQWSVSSPSILLCLHLPTVGHPTIPPQIPKLHICMNHKWRWPKSLDSMPSWTCPDISHKAVPMSLPTSILLTKNKSFLLIYTKINNDVFPELLCPCPPHLLTVTSWMLLRIRSQTYFQPVTHLTLSQDRSHGIHCLIFCTHPTSDWHVRGKLLPYTYVSTKFQSLP